MDPQPNNPAITGLTEHEALIEALKASHKTWMDDSEVEHKVFIDALEAPHKALIDDLEAKHKARMDDIEAEHKALIDELEAFIKARLDDKAFSRTATTAKPAIAMPFFGSAATGTAAALSELLSSADTTDKYYAKQDGTLHSSPGSA